MRLPSAHFLLKHIWTSLVLFLLFHLNHLIKSEIPLPKKIQINFPLQNTLFLNIYFFNLNTIKSAHRKSSSKEGYLASTSSDGFGSSKLSKLKPILRSVVK